MIVPCALTGLLLWATIPTTALPWLPAVQQPPEGLDHNSTISARADPGDFYLRIMPLGASIVAGEYSQSPAKNGFRKFTRDKLRQRGWKVNMVGNRNSGDMTDSDHEGISGEVVQSIAKRGREAARTWLPDVVLVNAGRNDANDRKGDVDANRTGLQMKELIQGIFAEVPQAVVVLSILLPKCTNADYADKVNDQYCTIYRQFVPADEDGNEDSNPEFKVVLAEMQPFLIMADIYDQTHPTTLGEKKMAAVWDWAISVAHDRGWIQPPKQNSTFSDSEGSSTCRKKFGSGASDIRSGRKILFASDPAIRDDGTYRHASQIRDDRKGIFSKVSGGGPDKIMTKSSDIWFAQLVNAQGSHKGDERDELIIAPWDKASRKLVVYLNNGNGEYNEEFQIDPRISCSNAHIRWGDVNGDGLDDFICIQENGELYVSIDKGGSPPTFFSVGLYKKQEMGLGRDRVRLGDMDSDGRLDYCVISNAGNIHCWRNRGIGDKAAYWQDMGSGAYIFKSQNMGDMRGVQLVDLNGDGRYDWTWMSKEGQAKTFINQRGDGKGMKPSWRDAGITHPGRGYDIGENREFIKWGRIFSGRSSYVNWKREPNELTYQVWENKGQGGISQKGDGIFWGDTTGSGVDDYVWISMHGEVNVFVNKNTRVKHDFYSTSAWGKPTMIKTGLPRRALHMADWDGDGKDDIIGVTNLKTGALKVWYSRWNNGKHNWDPHVIPNPPGREWCTQGHGRLPFDNAHHFADLTGSGRTDYIFMAPSGQAWAWLRGKDGVAVPSGQIKYKEDLDQANFQFADINGDGKADLLQKDKFNGDTRVWYFDKVVSEAERAGNSGSIIKWDRPEKVFRGSVRGPDTHYPRLNNQHRGDMVYAEATTAQARISFNICPAGGDDKETDTDLPTYTPPEVSPSPEKDWFCEKGNGAKWTPGLWRQHGVGTWLRQRTDIYSAAENSWPKPDPKEGDKAAEGVPRIIAEHDVFNREKTFNWPPSCRAVDSTCDFPNALEEADDCRKHQERAFSLWAMRNFALFQQKWYTAVWEGVIEASLTSADIADTFLSVKPEDADANPAAWLTIVAGIFTSIGAVAPAVGVGANLTAGIITVGAGAASFGSNSPDPNPELTSFWTRNATAAQFNRFFRDTPPEHDRELGSELGRTLESGDCADQDIAQADSDTIWDYGKIKSMVQGAMISEMWNTEQVAIVKWSKDHTFAKDWGFNPCFGGDKYSMDKHVACVNGQNYLIAKQITHDLQDDAEKWPNIGSDEDSLRKYNLDHSTIINAAERTQERAQRFAPRGLDNLGELFIKGADQSADGRAKYMTYFNVPVCDLNKLSTFDLYRDRVDEFDRDRCKKAESYYKSYLPFCVAHMLAKNCRKLILPGGQWPYQNDI